MNRRIIMNELRDKVISILNEVDEDICEFDGDDLIEEGYLDSFTIVSIMAKLQDELGISLKPDDVTSNNFKSVDAIVNLVSTRS